MRAYTSPCIGVGPHLYRCQFNAVAWWPFSRCPGCRQIMQRDNIGLAMSSARLYVRPGALPE